MNGLKIKDYSCAQYGESYLPKKDNKLWLYVNLADICNAHCPFCVNPSSPHKENSFDLSKFHQILDNIKPYVYGISITGGEPMLFPELVDEVAAIIDRTMDMETELDLVSNGSNLHQILQLRMLNRFESIHISRHIADDQRNEKLMGFAAPKAEEIKSIIQSLSDKAKIVFNCVMQKGGVETLSDMADYLEMAAQIGVRNSSFIGFFLVNEYCKEHYVSPATIDVNKDSRFQVWNHYHDYHYCSCSSGDYQAIAGRVRYYYRCPGSETADYTRQLVYTSDNRLLTGFGGKEIVLSCRKI